MIHTVLYNIFSFLHLLKGSEGALHQVSDGAVGVAFLEHEGHEEVRHGLGHIDLNATQQVQVGLAALLESVVEVNVSVHEFLRNKTKRGAIHNDFGYSYSNS